VQIIIKIVVTAVAGGLTYLLTNTTGQPDIWQLTMSVFVGGVVLVVQFLIDAAEQSRRTADLVREMNEAATLLAEAEGVLGSDSLTRLVKAAGGIERREDFQLRFAEQQVKDMTTLFRGLKAERASHDGENPDWLLGLTSIASQTIDATSLTSFGKYQGYVDEGEFWDSELGRRYLIRQRAAVERNVRIRRLFVLTDAIVDQDKLDNLLEPHKRIGVQTRVLHMDRVDFLHSVADLIVFDQKISYEFQTSKAARENTMPMLETVALMTNPDHLKRRQRDFEALWAAAEEKPRISLVQTPATPGAGG
jgi:hypothetical protein